MKRRKNPITKFKISHKQPITNNSKFHWAPELSLKEKDLYEPTVWLICDDYEFYFYDVLHNKRVDINLTKFSLIFATEEGYPDTGFVEDENTIRIVHIDKNKFNVTNEGYDISDCFYVQPWENGERLKIILEDRKIELEKDAKEKEFWMKQNKKLEGKIVEAKGLKSANIGIGRIK